MRVGFFTEGIHFELPHPSISERVILLICEVIDTAWHLLEQYPPANFSLVASTENEITAKLKEVIENRLRMSGEVPGFNKKTFGKMVRDSKISNYNGEHLDKMPDMFFDLKREDYAILSEHDGLFVECKPVDKDHPILSCYLKEGLNRFVNGDYAWAMQEALMIGYSNSKNSQSKLAIGLDNSNSAFLNTVSHSSLDSNHIYKSQHNRNFEWLDNYGKVCPIKVYHLWKFRV